MEHNKKEPDDDVHSMDVTPVYDPGTLIMLTSLLMAVMGIVLLLMERASTPRRRPNRSDAWLRTASP